ncbi:acid phosphatase [Methylobacterium oxalidis]|uniref:acid phosphatase n=1 Tax=Methylobacterium oxalidis TaxID=944322 RepID=UPI0033154595
MPRLLPPLAALALLVPAVTAAAPALAQERPVQERPGEKPPQKSAPSVGADTLKPQQPAHQPYLAEGMMPDTVAILPPPPASHSAAEAADKAAFNATRALKGTTRWELAASDVAEGAPAILDNFACVLGTRLDQARVPALMTLLERARLDIARGTRAPKVHYRRLRPFVGNEAPICVQRSQQLADSYSYPSGHASQGWAYALIMASLVPEKASAILVRGRAYGESRVICGVHWMSDVEAGRTNGAAIVAALQANATFRADLERARADLGKALAGGGPAPDQAACAREETAARMPEL